MLTIEHGQAVTVGTRDPFELARLLKSVADEYGVTVDELKSPRRSRPLPQIRAEFCKRAWGLNRHSTPQIGKAINRTHWNVLYAIGRHAGRTPSYLR